MDTHIDTSKQQQLFERIQGLVAPSQIKDLANDLKGLASAEYEQRVLQPPRNPKRLSAKKAVEKIMHTCLADHSDGALFAFDMVLSTSSGKMRRVAVIGHDRDVNQGSWNAAQHRKATLLAQRFGCEGLPVICFIDTPGAAADQAANEEHQAQGISELIATMMALPTPSIGIVWGLGYSGGAIPFAATDLLFATSSSLFSTIQPEGLSSIARKQRLSWQSCAQLVSVSAAESMSQGWIDGVLSINVEEKSPNLTSLGLTLLDALDFIELEIKQSIETLRPTDPETQQWSQWMNRLISGDSKVIDHPLMGSKTRTQNLAQYSLRSRRHHHICSKLSHTSLSALIARPNATSKPLDQIIEQRDTPICNRWACANEKLNYLPSLKSALERYLKTGRHKADKRGTLTTLLLGDAEENHLRAQKALVVELGFYAYLRWKPVQTDCLAQIISHMQSDRYREHKQALETFTAGASLTSWTLLHIEALQPDLIKVLQSLEVFDQLYDGLIEHLSLVAREANDRHCISRTGITRLLDKTVSQHQTLSTQMLDIFLADLLRLTHDRDIGEFLSQVADIKRAQHPRIADSLYVLINYLMAHLLPRYVASEDDQARYDGRIIPKKIGRQKDFWHRLFVAQCDLQILEIQNQIKSHNPSWSLWLDELFSHYETTHDEWVSADHCRFPGFKDSIQKSASNSIPAGMVTGVGMLKDHEGLAGFIVSNSEFQAGAMDTASACKMIDLIERCQQERWPIIGIISSGGMQTKEGAASLFGMAAVNEAITRYRQITDLPIIMIGYGDCTGGAQASFMTHPLVDTWYVSGANIPFAGQRVVPSYLPSTCSLANYLVEDGRLMRGLIKHPFAPRVDIELKQIDPATQIPRLTMRQAVETTLLGIEPSPTGSLLNQTNDLEKVYGPVKSVMVHARGCTATKIVSDLKDAQIRVVLLQSDPDMNSHAASLIDSRDELICLGGHTPEESYLNANSVLRLAQIWEVDAIHPGIGFLSENAEFTQACQVQGLNFIGPDYRSIKSMGDKAAAIQTARNAGVPVVPGSYKTIGNESELLHYAKKVGFPLLLKAAYGGGGKGIEKLDSSEQLKEAFQRLSLEAFGAFGKGDLYMEKFVTSIRHIEVQVARDRYGHTKLLGLRDCSIQRANQKLIEESQSTAIDSALQAKAFESAELLVNHINYVGIGTVEFIYDCQAGAFYFMEMNTRLQVEHPVTEAVSGIRLIPLQIKIAEGQSIEALNWHNTGHALEVRVAAEKVVIDGELIITSSPGNITRMSIPEDPNVKVIQSVHENGEVTPYYDSLVMQIIAHGTDRSDSIRKMIRFLSNILIDGVNTNLALLIAILKDSDFQACHYNTRFLEDFASRVPPDELNQKVLETCIDASEIRVENSDELMVFAPSSGVIYASSSPGDQPFAQEGDIIEVEQTLCLIESMKMYRSFSLNQHNSSDQKLYPSTNRYQIQKIFATDGQQISEGDLLFVVEPIETPS